MHVLNARPSIALVKRVRSVYFLPAHAADLRMMHVRMYTCTHTHSNEHTHTLYVNARGVLHAQCAKNLMFTLTVPFIKPARRLDLSTESERASYPN